MKKKKGMSFRGRLAYFISMFLVVIIGLSSVYLFTPSNGASVIMINKYLTKIIQGEDQYQLNITDLGGGGTDASGNSISGNVVGPITAEGDYSLSLGDGDTIYWYHQSTPFCGCKYCGDWSQAKMIGNGGVSTQIGKGGCAVYSLAISLSNILGKQITPNDILTALGATRVGSNWSVANNPCFTGVDMYREPALARLKQAYGISYESLNSNGGVDAQDRITKCLNKGGVYWQSWVDSSTEWCGSGDASHFMSIRKEDANNYYCYTSCRGKCSPVGGVNGAVITMNYPIEKNKCLSTILYPDRGYLIYIK